MDDPACFRYYGAHLFIGILGLALGPFHELDAESQTEQAADPDKKTNLRFVRSGVGVFAPDLNIQADAALHLAEFPSWFSDSPHEVLLVELQAFIVWKDLKILVYALQRRLLVAVIMIQQYSHTCCVQRVFFHVNGP